MKVDNKIIEPKSEFYFDNVGKNKVYFYLKENNSISLSEMFDHCNKMLYFSFNNNVHIEFEYL